MYAEKEIQTSLLLLHLFAVLRYVQEIQIPRVGRVGLRAWFFTVLQYK